LNRASRIDSEDDDYSMLLIRKLTNGFFLECTDVRVNFKLVEAGNAGFA